MHKATEYAVSVVCSMYILSGIWNVHILSDRDAGRKLWQYREYRQRATTTTTTATALRSARSHKSKPEQAAGKLRACSLTAQAKVTPNGQRHPQRQSKQRTQRIPRNPRSLRFALNFTLSALRHASAALNTLTRLHLRPAAGALRAAGRGASPHLLQSEQ